MVGQGAERGDESQAGCGGPTRTPRADFLARYREQKVRLERHDSPLAGALNTGSIKDYNPSILYIGDIFLHV